MSAHIVSDFHETHPKWDIYITHSGKYILKLYADHGCYGNRYTFIKFGYFLKKCTWQSEKSEILKYAFPKYGSYFDECLMDVNTSLTIYMYNAICDTGTIEMVHIWKKKPPETLHWFNHLLQIRVFMIAKHVWCIIKMRFTWKECQIQVCCLVIFCYHMIATMW